MLVGLRGEGPKSHQGPSPCWTIVPFSAHLGTHGLRVGPLNCHLPRPPATGCVLLRVSSGPVGPRLTPKPTTASHPAAPKLATCLVFPH